MKKYKIDFIGTMYLEADTKEEAEEKFFDGIGKVSAEKQIDSVIEVDEFVIGL